MKKKVLSAIVCAAMVFSMTACGLQSPNTGGNSGGTTNAASTSNASATSDAAEAETTTEAASSGDSATEPVGPVFAYINGVYSCRGIASFLKSGRTFVF